MKPVFQIELEKKALRDVERHEKAGNKHLLKKIGQLLNELRVHPTTGTGKPELLKHYKEPTWSRRIDHKHRMVYEVHDDRVIVLVLSLWGHYGDK